MAEDIKPQHDFDEQKRIRWEITQKGREALKPQSYSDVAKNWPMFTGETERIYQYRKEMEERQRSFYEAGYAAGLEAGMDRIDDEIRVAEEHG